MFQFVRPLVGIRDTELIKKILIKDFEFFFGHNALIPEEQGGFGRNLFSLKGFYEGNLKSR